MLSVSWDTIRLFLHVLAATIWVGGQITLAALVPVLRRLGAEIPRTADRHELPTGIPYLQRAEDADPHVRVTASLARPFTITAGAAAGRPADGDPAVSRPAGCQGTGRRAR